MLEKNYLFKRKGFIVNHTPNKTLTTEEKEYIKANGLVHFFSEQYWETTRKNGLLIKWAKPIKKGETGDIWFFINDEQGRTTGLKEYCSKKAPHRESEISKICQCIWFPNDEEIEKLRFRPVGRALLFYTYNSPAIVFGEDIPADHMEIKRVE